MLFILKLSLQVATRLQRGHNNKIVAVVTLMSMSRVDAMLLLRLKVGSIEVGCPMPRRYYELINAELGMLSPLLEDVPSLTVTITASTILEEWTALALVNLVSTGLSMVFKLIGIVVD